MANQSPVRRLTVRDIARAKGGEPIVSLTAYTAPVARIVDEACDFILVGDSLGMVLYGMDSTVGVTVDMMVVARPLGGPRHPAGLHRRGPALRLLRAIACPGIRHGLARHGGDRLCGGQARRR